MKKPDKKSKAAFLRQKAEEIIKSMIPVKDALRSWMSEPDALKLIHELEVHQVELDLTNEELLLAAEQAEAAIQKYTELYDFAPSGYFTLNESGEIIELNLCGSQMLGKDRSKLKNILFGFFVSDDTKPAFNLFLKKAFNSKFKESCEVTLATGSNLPMDVHIIGIVDETGKQCHFTVVDLTAEKKALKSVVKSSHLKNLILEAAGEGIIGIDLTGNQTFANPMAVTILGYSAEELMGKNFHDLIHHHHRDGTVYHKEDCSICNTLLNGKPAHGEDYFWRKDGTGFPIEYSCLPIVEEYAITGAVLTFRDITARKSAEEDARRAYEILEATLDAMPDQLFDVGLDGYIYNVHSPRTELLNLPAADIIGKIIPDILPPDISDVLMAAIKEANDKGYSSGKQYELKVPMGTRWFEISVSRKVNAPDTAQHFIILRRDITESKMVYNAFRRSEAILHKMVSKFGAVVVLLDQDGVNRYKSPNIEKYFGWKPEEVVGISTWEMVHPEDRVSTQKFVGDLIDQPNATGTAKCRYRCKDGSYRKIEITVVNLLHDPDIRGLLGNYHEITKRKRT